MAIEIERKFLLDGLPSLPPEAAAYRMEQGYFEDGGRIRRTVDPDGTVTFTHTVKKGKGLVREEDERTIPEDEFLALWPQTTARRLRKTRYCVEVGEFVWEIDDYGDLQLYLAEVELPSSDTEAALPPWLAPHVVRDVTDEAQYQNYEIALRKPPGGFFPQA